MYISIRQKLLLCSFIILVGNWILGYAVYNSNQKLLDSEKWVHHSEQVIYTSDKILSLAKDIETASRGFIITNDSTFLEPLYSAKANVFVLIRQLKQLINNNLSQQQRIDSLDFYIVKRLDFSLKTITIRTEQGLPAAIAYTATRQGKYYTDRIRQIISDIQQTGNVSLAERKRINVHNGVVFNQYLVVIFVLMASINILLIVAIGKYLLQNEEKEERAAELLIANEELSYQSDEKEKRAEELIIANRELLFQNSEKEKRAGELLVANKELLYQNEEKGKRAGELFIANEELLFQNDEKEKRAGELWIANEELLYQNQEKENRAAELVIANKELSYQSGEKEKRAAELVVANVELSYQNEEKEKRAAELVIANVELFYQNKEKEKRAAELIIANEELSRADTERIKMVNDLMVRNTDLEQFAYIISHNLRAPVANIIGASGALNDEDLTDDDKTMLNKAINTSVMKLDDVVKDLNHILEVKSSINETREMVHFSLLVNDIKDSIKSMIKSDFEITHDFSQLDEFLTIKPYLYSVFYNLISNSLKYCRQNTSCTIKIKSRVVNNILQLIFTDNGLGIDLLKNGDQVFGLYRRFHPGIEGKGMGLYMVKTQVETLGGKISVQSKENEGAEFIIEFEM